MKILSDEELVVALERERRAGRTIVFTNGCFTCCTPAICKFSGSRERKATCWWSV